MLTKKENFLETQRGGSPDRLVNQYEYLTLISNPIALGCRCPKGATVVTNWGYTLRWDEGTPGAFPVHTEDSLVLPDVTQWKNLVKPPDPHAFSESDWAPFVELSQQVDRNESYVACSKATGLFERLHYLMGIDTTLINFYEEPEAMYELIEFITDWELELAKILITQLKPNALFQHDDWGTQINSFFSPDIFNEFFVPSYKRLYGFYKDNGVEIIVHHSDSYAANLVPAMIEIGIDVWQGAVQENDIPHLVKTYGKQLTIQGGMDNGKFDTENWSRAAIRKGLRELVEACGTSYFIPSGTMGIPGSIYPGVYDVITEEITMLSKELLK